MIFRLRQRASSASIKLGAFCIIKASITLGNIRSAAHGGFSDLDIQIVLFLGQKLGQNFLIKKSFTSRAFFQASNEVKSRSRSRAVSLLRSWLQFVISATARN